jgi:hypothetical protein
MAITGRSSMWEARSVAPIPLRVSLCDIHSPIISRKAAEDAKSFREPARRAAPQRAGVSRRRFLSVRVSLTPGNRPRGARLRPVSAHRAACSPLRDLCASA